MDYTKTLLRKSEIIQTLGKITVESKNKPCVFSVVKNRSCPYEYALFIIQEKSLFRRPKIFMILPLTIELKVIPQSTGYSLYWSEENPLLLLEFFSDELLIEKLISLTNSYSRYQQEPFFIESSHHKWLWFYQEYIPKVMHSPSFISSEPLNLLEDDYGKNAMEAYVSERLKMQESMFTSNEQIKITVLTWNVAGLSPSGELGKWIQCRNLKFINKEEIPDIVAVGLQEICELTKLLGDSTRENEWAAYLKNQVELAFEGNSYIIVSSI